MEIYKTIVTFYNNGRDINNTVLPTELKILNITNTGYLNFKIIQNNKIIYFQHKVINPIEYLLFYEIINGSGLWKYTYTIKPTNFYVYNFIFTIKFFIEPKLIKANLNISFALNLAISTFFDKLPIFNKFDNSKSYVSLDLPIEPSNDFLLTLYDYQKKSLAKMINMENKNFIYEIEYTQNIILKDITILFNPITNLNSEIKKYFKLNVSGGVFSDEMGLGKTITSIALIDKNPSLKECKLKFSKKNTTYKIYSKATLILCPSHIITQWKAEINKCNPKLKVITIMTKVDHEKLSFNQFITADIIITSHSFLMNFKYYPCLYYRKITPSIFKSDHRSKEINKYLNEKILINYNNYTTDEINNIDENLFEIIKQTKIPLFEFFHFHRLILDEGHEIFGEMLSNVALSKYMSEWLNQLDVDFYWYVSGSPFINFNGIINCSKFINLKLSDDDININFNEIILNDKLFNNLLSKEYLWNNILEKICIRHTKNNVVDEIELFGYNEHVEWIDFTDIEKNIYESKKNKSDYYLLQLCCHPLIIESHRKIFGNNDLDLAVMQDTLITEHKKNIEISEDKIKILIPTSQGYTIKKKAFENIINESKYILTILQKMVDITLIDDSDKNCSICLEDILQGSMTKCGHLFCSDCIKKCIKCKKECPICKKALDNDEIYSINKNPIEKKNDIANPLIQKYGSKLGKIILMIRQLVLIDESRIIIFSQWDAMLLLIGKTLSENGIANSFVKGNIWSRNCAIKNFKNGKTLSGQDNKVIMLSLKNSASGTNLTEATHIFFVEPINTNREEMLAIEGQAIGRACRLGQTKKIELYRILIKNTVEEIIYNKVYKNINLITNNVVSDNINNSNYSDYSDYSDDSDSSVIDI